MKLASYTCLECDCDFVYGEWCYYCRQCGQMEDGPHPKKGWLKSKGAQYDPLKHFRFWITDILGVEPLSELGDAYQLFENIKLLMTRD